MDKEVKKNHEHVRDKQTAYWGNVAAAGNNTAGKPAQTETATATTPADPGPEERTSSRQRMTQ